MSLTRVQNFSISLDGFGTGEPQSQDAPSVTPVRVCTSTVRCTSFSRNRGSKSLGPERAADRSVHPRVLGARRIPEMMVCVDDGHGDAAGAGAFSAMSPSLRRSSHNDAGTSCSNMRTFSSTSPVDAQPLRTLATAAWPSGNWIAAAFSGAPRRLQRRAVALADGTDTQRLRDHVGGRCSVVVDLPALGIGKDPAVEDASDDHRDACVEAERQKLGEARLVEQCVAPGQQEAVKTSPRARASPASRPGSSPRRQQRSRPRHATGRAPDRPP
jgi:hypothetical protein